VAVTTSLAEIAKYQNRYLGISAFWIERQNSPRRTRGNALTYENPRIVLEAFCLAEGPILNGLWAVCAAIGSPFHRVGLFVEWIVFSNSCVVFPDQGKSARRTCAVLLH
jgi:hypothetical protein